MLYSIEDTTMKSFADTIREKNGTTAEMRPEEMITAIQGMYGNAELYKNTFYGTDTNSLSVSLPWKPDYVTIVSFDAAAATANTFIVVSCSFDTVGTFAGIVGVINARGAYAGASHAKASFGNFFSYADGVFTYTPPSVSPYNAALWRSGVNYLIFATRGENNG